MPQECDRRVVQPNAALYIHLWCGNPKVAPTGFGTFLIAHHIEFDTDPNKLKPKKEFSNFPDILKSQMKEIQLITAQHTHHAFRTLPDLKTQPYRLGVLHTLKSFDQVCHQWKLEKDQKLWKDSKLTVLGMRKKIETQGECEVLAIEDDLAAEILKLK